MVVRVHSGVSVGVVGAVLGSVARLPAPSPTGVVAPCVERILIRTLVVAFRTTRVIIESDRAPRAVGLPEHSRGILGRAVRSESSVRKIPPRPRRSL